MRVAFLVLMFVLGTCFGSFFCCEARRLHYKETNSKKKLPARSICLKCGYKLKWYDNLPLISWLILKGKCRKCGKKIGIGEFISELSVGLTFLLITLGLITSLEPRFGQPPLLYLNIALIIVLVLSLLFLAVYDGLYGELPTPFLTISIICAIIIVCISGLSWGDILNYATSAAILGGTYLLLYLVSRGKWVGDGDWLLGVAIGLALKTPWLSLIVLFLSNFIACLVIAPFSKGKNIKIPFGPFLVAAFIIVYSFADILMNML